MTKRVNIYPSTPILSVIPIIRGVVKSATKDTDTIRKCIIARAKVEEILPDGTCIVLDLNNYNKDNTFKEEAPVETTPEAAAPETAEPVVEIPVVDETPTESVSDEVEEDAREAESDVATEEAPAEAEETSDKDVYLTIPDDMKTSINEETKEEVADEEAKAEETPAVESNDTEEAPAVEEVDKSNFKEVESTDIAAALDELDTSAVTDADDGLDNDENGL